MVILSCFRPCKLIATTEVIKTPTHTIQFVMIMIDGMSVDDAVVSDPNFTNAMFICIPSYPINAINCAKQQKKLMP